MKNNILNDFESVFHGELFQIEAIFVIFLKKTVNELDELSKIYSQKIMQILSKIEEWTDL